MPMPQPGTPPALDSEAPALDPGAPQDTPQDDGYEICIRVSTDKSLSVCVERGGMPMGASPDDMGGGLGGDAGGDDEGSGEVPCKSIKEALTLALDIYRNDGQLPKSADDAFQQGFGSPASTQGGGL